MEDNKEGPKLIWTFPIFRRIQSGIVLDFSQPDNSVRQQVVDSVENVTEDKPVRSVITNDDDDDELDTLEEEIQDVQQSSEDVFGDTYSQTDSEELVTMSGDTFIPLRISVQPGESIRWENEDDSSHTIMTTNNEEIDKVTVESGEEYTYTFDEEGIYKYVDTILGGNSMCGVVIVGDQDFNGTLRCESDVDREIFANDTMDDTSSNVNRSMSQAADERMENRSYSDD